MPRFIKKHRKKPDFLQAVWTISGIKKSIQSRSGWSVTMPTIEASFPYRDTPPVTWINVDGLHDLKVVKKPATISGFIPWCWRISSIPASAQKSRSLMITSIWNEFRIHAETEVALVVSGPLGAAWVCLRFNGDLVQKKKWLKSSKKQNRKFLYLS